MASVVTHLCFLVALFLVVQCNPLIDSLLLYPDDHEVRICGRRLIQTVQRLCNYRVAVHIEGHSRQRRGLAHECCSNTCTIGHMKTFCESPVFSHTA